LSVARVCLVTKRPHATSDRAVAAVADRLTAAGAEVLRIRRATDGDAVVKALYPAAHERYTVAPTAKSTWDALRKRFDGKRFTTVFGEPYAPDLVVPGAVAAARFGLSEPGLTAIWEEGRPPVTRETLASRYGANAAEVLTAGGSHYAWFRGPWPVGIQRIAPGLMAFALRHERLGDRPLIVLNGHVPGLAELFGEGTAIIGVGLDGLSVAELRHRVVGDDNRPERCAPGTIRRDAADGTFPLDPGPPVDSRRNVVHCSDGLLAGERESRALLGPEPGALTEQLHAAGLTHDEIETIVLRDPVVAADGVEQPLTDATSGMDLVDTVRTITHFFPPVFGAANGFASGLSLATFVREVHARSEADTTEIRATTAIAPPAEHEQAGIAAMDAVGFVVPAGGTGGRFGGYGLPETHPDRQKALVPVFEADGKPVSALDIRLANVRYWRAATGARLPVAVMASPTSHDALAAWARKNDAELYDQHGVYRLRPGAERWFDRVAREPDGTPSLKPPGHLGALTCLALSGILDRWAADGIEYLAVANGDDVGFRLDPRIVGMLAADPGLDAVVAGVRWGPSDSGGAICEVRTGDGWRVGVAESGGQDRLADPLYSTNQFVVRVEAVRRVFGLPGDVVAAVRRFVDRQPFHVERKKVGDADAVQLQQRINAVFSHLRMAVVRLSRDEPLDTRGSYAGLKRRDDVPFGQWLLDKRADDLLF
jgi:hypothetical protein